MQNKLSPSLSKIIAKYPNLVAPLMSLEQSVKDLWPYDLDSPQAKAYSAKLNAQEAGFMTTPKTASWIQTLLRSVSQRSSSGEQGSRTVLDESRTKIILRE